MIQLFLKHNCLLVSSLRRLTTNFKRFVPIATVIFTILSNPDVTLAQGEEACVFGASVSVECWGMNVNFNGNNSNLAHDWDFGDGSDIVLGGDNMVSHVYHDINPFSTPITALHRVVGFDFWCTRDINFPGIFIGEGCGTTRHLSTLIATGILPADQLTSRTLFVYGDLVVDVPYAFEACSLKVLEGGKIIVKSGGRLTLSGNTVADNLPGSGGCDNLWGGIEVHWGAQLITNGATIRNAYYAIHSIGAVKKLAPVLSLNNTIFQLNFISITSTGVPFILSDFSQNSFQGSGNTAIKSLGSCSPPEEISGLTYARRTYVGIFVGTLIMPASAASNTFANLQAGIVVRGGSATISGCKFENILSISGNSAPHQGTAITLDQPGNPGLSRDITITGLGKNSAYMVRDCERGIYATASSPNRVNIKDCRIEKVQSGIVLETLSWPGALNEAIIEDNYIDCSRYFSLTPTQQTSTGVEIRHPNFSRCSISIQRNDIYINQTAAFPPLENMVIFPTAIRIVALLPQNGVANSSTNIQIKGNVIELIAGYRGILLNNCANTLVDDNQIHSSNSINHQQIAIQVEGGINNILSCNTVSSLTPIIGIFLNSSVGFTMDANTVTDMFSCISIANDNGTDCVVGSNNIISENVHIVGLFYNNALTGPQYLQGNIWDGTFTTGAGYQHGPGSHTYCNSRYHVSPTANIAGNSSNIVFVDVPDPTCGNWFTVLNTSEESHECVPPFNNPDIRLNEADQRLASSGGTSSLSPGFRWSGEIGLYRKFTERPDLIGNDSIISTFMQNQANQPVALTYTTRDNFVNIFNDTDLENDIEPLQQQTDIIRTDMADIQDQVTIDSLAWLDWSEWNDLADSLQTAAQLLAEQFSTLLEGTAANLQTENNSIVCNDQPCLNEQYLRDLFLETRVVNPRGLTFSEQTQIRTIATTCPGEGGPAVFLARSWHYSLVGEIVTDSCSSPLPGSLLEERSMENDLFEVTRLTVLPNPADARTSIAIPALSNEAQLFIVDACGRTVQHRTIPANEGREVTFTTERLPSGIYIIVLRSEVFNSISPVKLIVNH